MKVEVSCLFRTDYHAQEVVRTHLGDNVWIERIEGSDWLEDVMEKEPKLQSKQELGWGRFRHRFLVTVPETRDENDSKVKEAEQLICQAIVLSRIIKPLPIAMYDAWVWTAYRDDADPAHKISVRAGFGGEAYVINTNEEQQFEEGDVMQMTQLWARFHQFFLDEPQHRRIVRALRYFDNGYYISIAEQRHMAFHAALESMICTKSESKGSAVKTRFPQLVPSLKHDDAELIYNLWCEIKHEAAPIFLNPNSSGVNNFKDTQRLKATQLLEMGLRELFRRSITEPKIADALCNELSLMKYFPLPKKARK